MMRRLLAIATAPLLLSCGAAVSSPTWLDDAALSVPGFGQAAFRARDGHRIPVLVYRPRAFDSTSGPVWFVMHGASRDAERYVRSAAPVAERHAALLVVPHFTKEAYPKGSDYTLDPELYREIERLFDLVRGSLGGTQRGYYIFGHSAGAQFVHRMLTFVPGARSLGAVAANAGWYTLPSTEKMPYGLRGAKVSPADLRGFFASRFVVLLGERDTTTAETDDLVRGTPEAQAQGATRLERGRSYLATAKETAREIGAKLAWDLEVVPRAGHDAARMLPSAGFLLFVPGEPPCRTTEGADASGLEITDILDDPPQGPAGDANGDGRRDPSEDERVEIVNTGKTPVCLSGWALGDAKDPERHVFPLGKAVAPGGKVIVFGGGVPTGAFGGAEVEWAAHGLDLDNKGDVVTLRDRTDAIVRQVSWGDCDGARCAEDHRR